MLSPTYMRCIKTVKSKWSLSVMLEKILKQQKEFRYALDVFNEFPESRIFVIPVRLDDCEIPYEKLKDIHYIDLFPDCTEGMKGVIHAIAEEQWEEGYYPHS